jgi:hypothetical protein
MLCDLSNEVHFTICKGFQLPGWGESGDPARGREMYTEVVGGR